MTGQRPGGVAEVTGAVAACLPDYRVDSVVPLGEGMDNVAYEVNGELIVRFSREPDPNQLDREARLLAAVAAIAPVPVPQPAFAIPERGCLAYPKLPGTPLLDLPRRHRSDEVTSVAGTLGALLAVLHAVPTERVTDLVDTDDQPLTEWRREAAEIYRTVVDRIPLAHRGSVEAFLNGAPPEDGYPLVFSHNDLGIEHVLVDPGTWAVTGVIDWSDAALVDPAYDFGLLYRDLGPRALRAAFDRYRTDRDDLAALHERAVFYARCSVFEDLAYGIETGRDRYVANSLAVMEWLFPSPGLSVRTR